MPIEVANLKLKSIFSDDSQHRYQMSKISITTELQLLEFLQ